MEINERSFAAICYLVLMDHHGEGYNEAHPAYAEEKLHLLEAGFDAYGFLDRENQERVKRHLVRWGFELPVPVRTYEKRLGDAGIFGN